MLTRPSQTRPPLELWGGHECTVNRVRDTFSDQNIRSGHEHRLEDLALFAGLGVKSLRYPVLWERVSPGDPDVRDFRWTDERLAEIARLGMNPIVTLTHHGSGPSWTSLVQDSFAPGLAVHAAATAQRYPWVTDYTPVNEPLTTARFSALYGYWYPHTLDERLFWTALLNEIDATRLAMREIRRVNPAARLVQTDDLGYCHATEPLQCEADFQNQRRWMGWDLLCGMVVPGHALWDRLVGFGLEERLRVIAVDPCPPAVIGVNHYLSSERLLDHRIERHPHRAIADRELGNCAGVPFVDVDAIRHWEDIVGIEGLLRQAWERYRIPVAVTECHNGATREEQVRWFVEGWRSAERLREQGVDLRAVTAWSLLGSYDWNRMVTRVAGHYEPGVYDVRGGGEPRPTRMVPVLRDLAAGREPQAPGLEIPGWWRRRSRFVGAPAQTSFERTLADPGDAPPLLLVGDDGPLTTLAVRACEVRGLPYVRCGRDLAVALDATRPWAVLDTRDREGLAGLRRRGACPHGARSSVARICADAGVPCALFTSAFGPGLAAEGLSLPGVLVARTGPLYLPWDSDSFAVRALETLEAGRPVFARAGVWHGVYGPDLLDATLDLLLDGAEGGFNFFPPEGLSNADWLRTMAAVAECEPSLVNEHAQSVVGVAYPGGPAASYLPLSESTLERFVREARLAREEGRLAVHRREDDVRQEEAVSS